MGLFSSDINWNLFLDVDSISYWLICYFNLHSYGFRIQLELFPFVHIVERVSEIWSYYMYLNNSVRKWLSIRIKCTFSFKKNSNVIKKLYYQDFFFTVYRDKSIIFFPLCILILAFWSDSWNKLLSLLSDGVENMLSLRKLYIYSLWSSFLNFRFPCTCTIYYHFMCSITVWLFPS